jgi:hypothetical protein
METRSGERGREHGGPRWRLFGSALGMVLALVVAPGCQGQGGGDPVVLTVGPREVGARELERAFWSQQKSDHACLPDSASLRRFLPVYADRAIGEEVAREAIPVLGTDPQDRVDEYEEQLITDALRREAYIDGAQPTRGELADAYANLGRELHLRYMVVGDRKEAEDLILVLRQGGLFSRIAPQKSLDARSRETGGDIGWVTYRNFDPEIASRIWALKPGEIAGPLPSNGQWQIFQMVEERPNVGRGTFEAETPMLRLAYLSSRGTAGARRFQEDLLRKYEFRTDPEEVAWMTALLREKTASVPRDIGAFNPTELDDPEVQKKINGNPFQTPPVAPADTGRVLATFNGPGGRITPYVVIDQLLGGIPLSWPKFERTEDVVEIIRGLVLERLVILEARARKIDQRPEIRALLADKEREVRARYYFRTKIRPAARLSETALRAYYDSHPAEFHQSERRRFVALNTSDTGLAGEIQKQLQAGLAPSEIKTRLGGRDQSLTLTGDKGTNPMEYGQSPMLDSVLFALPKGGVSGPIPVEGRWTVAKVVEILPERNIPFEEAMSTIRQKTTPARADSMVKAGIDEARPRYPVKIFEEALRKVRLAPPTED